MLETNLDPASFIPNVETVAKLLIAMVGGLLLGLDREIRGKSAGLRTHALVSTSSAVITISAVLIYREAIASEDVISVDPLRVVQGLAQAIGFIAAGTIIFSRGNVRNLTTAANLWLCAGIGIAAGAGQFGLVVAALVSGLLILTIIRVGERITGMRED